MFTHYYDVCFKFAPADACISKNFHLENLHFQWGFKVISSLCVRKELDEKKHDSFKSFAVKTVNKHVVNSAKLINNFPEWLLVPSG
jgi:hypothetical protein